MHALHAPTGSTGIAVDSDHEPNLVEAAPCTRADHAEPRRLLGVLRKFIRVRMLCATAPPDSLQAALPRLDGLPFVPPPLAAAVWRAEAAAVAGRAD